MGCFCQKVAELGGKVVTISGPDGYVYDPDGVVTKEKIDYLVEMRTSGRDRAQDYADKFGCKFVAKTKPWAKKVDIAMPCATQNEITMEEIKKSLAMVQNTILKLLICLQQMKLFEYAQNNLA